MVNVKVFLLLYHCTAYMVLHKFIPYFHSRPLISGRSPISISQLPTEHFSSARRCIFSMRKYKVRYEYQCESIHLLVACGLAQKKCKCKFFNFIYILIRKDRYQTSYYSSYIYIYITHVSTRTPRYQYLPATTRSR